MSNRRWPLVVVSLLAVFLGMLIAYNEFTYSSVLPVVFVAALLGALLWKV